MSCFNVRTGPAHRKTRRAVARTPASAQSSAGSTHDLALIALLHQHRNLGGIRRNVGERHAERPLFPLPGAEVAHRAHDVEFMQLVARVDSQAGQNNGAA